MSDYFAYKRAEQLIDGSSIPHKSKEKCESVLKGVAVYKGMEEFCNHANDKVAKYDFMSVIGSDSVAKKYIKVLDEELGINPVVISRAIAMERKLDRLDNLLKLIKANTYQFDWNYADTDDDLVDIPEDTPILYGESISSEITY